MRTVWATAPLSSHNRAYIRNKSATLLDSAVTVGNSLPMARPDQTSRRIPHAVALLLVALVLSACAQKPAPSGFSDPMETQNRQIHDFNRSVDRAVLRPLSGGYDAAVPDGVEIAVSNVARNLGAPGDILNGLLQGRPHHAVENTFRLVLNTTVGIGGLFDPATELGIPGKKTDFGETLHVWGVGEGNYLEFPLIGPSTERDLVGTFVDIAIDPLRYALPPREGNVATAFKLGSRLGDRARYSDTVDSVLYDSADSYAQTRLLYLQNRRYELGQTGAGASDDDFIDPYEDPYGQ